MYRAVLFDLDGTIADTLESIAFASNKALEACGLKALAKESYKYYAGDGADILIQRALVAAGDTENIHFQKAYEEYKVFFEKDCTYMVKPFDGILKSLEVMKKKKLKIAVVTNKPHNRAVTVVETIFGKNYFDFIIGQTQEIPKKPNPAMAFYAAKMLGISPSDCMYVGDTDVDMKTGNAAGMFTVGVLWGFREKEELEANHAHVLVANPKELLALI